MSEKRPNVIQLRPDVGPDEDVVACCEKLLALAKAGELSGLAWVGVDNGGGTKQALGGVVQPQPAGWRGTRACDHAYAVFSVQSRVRDYGTCRNVRPLKIRLIDGLQTPYLSAID